MAEDVFIGGGAHVQAHGAIVAYIGIPTAVSADVSGKGDHPVGGALSNAGSSVLVEQRACCDAPCALMGHELA